MCDAACKVCDSPEEEHDANPEAMQFMPLIIMGTSAGVGAKSDAMRASIMKRGAPGGCPTSSLYEVAMNSLQSHRLVEGSIVSR